MFMLGWKPLAFSDHMEMSNDEFSHETTTMSRRDLLTGTSVGILAATAGTLAFLNPQNAAAFPSAEGWYNLKVDFGAKGNGRDDDTIPWRNAISAGSTHNRPIFVPPGNYKITQSLRVPSNTMIVGSNNGLGFGCVLRPSACAAFDIGGFKQSFHCSIENLMIWPQGAAPDHIISIDNSYSVCIRNVRIYEAQVNLGTAAVVLLGDPSVGGHGKCNNVIWENLIVRNDSSMPLIAVMATLNCGTHRFVNPNIEFYQILFEWRGGQLDIINPYTERAGKHAVNCNLEANDTAAYLNTIGGLFDSAASGVTCAIRSTTRNFNSFGTKWMHPSNNAVYVYGLPSTTANFYGIVPNVSGAGVSRFAGVSSWQGALNFPDYLLRNSKVWSVTVPARGQIITTISVSGVQPGAHWARANMNIDLQGVQLSAYVSAADTVTVLAQNNKDSSINLNGVLRVSGGWG